MTLQEIFDKVAKHLLTQNKKALGTALDDDGEATCAYWDRDNDLRCAVGCLITKEAYDPAIEGNTADTTCVMKALEQSGVNTRSFEVMELLTNLQRIHDIQSPPYWREKLSELAEDSRLNATYCVLTKPVRP